MALITLRDIRKAKGLTIEEVTMDGGPKFSAYYKLDAGTADIEEARLRTFLQICKGLNMSPNDLLKNLGIDWKNPPR